ncbi:DUF4369 domain-containing protein [Chitinophaga nivalis]|uniref:DUF4369 domain-containing protein n=1 Tax=Chitinophaga nivalis TaxID=2991709 RepID=A0ABT3IHS5_9BACT|nr:DUF4369 domain-containing protein [Chitinophaga nivalis]MCW3467000.1 DUF4369 domain-containing protein [Chitinophaga nivalis]MCW3483309.1 DUF4369 domain-containing protein [Chitinophaga nivalis]
MKQYIRLMGTWLLLLLPYFSFSQYHYCVEGEFDNKLLGDVHPYSFKDGDTITMELLNSRQCYTTIIKDGHFKFEGEVATPAVASIVLSKKMGTKILIDSSKYVCTFFQEKLANNKVGYDVKVVTTSFFHNLWVTLAQKQGALGKKQRELQELIANSESGYQKNVYKEEWETVNKSLSDLYYQASVTYKGTYEMTYILQSAPDLTYDRYIHYYNELPEAIKKSFYGKRLYEKLMATKK